jgi:hypothetical protein
MYKFEIEPFFVEGSISADEMKIGQMGTIMGGAYAGETIMRIYEHIVSLNNANNTWDELKKVNFKIKLLPKGTKITLTVRD